ncbi:MAG: quinol:cytochrome C oxidoreductase, partial [Candidatus Methylomirabilis sp.]|nr:quinol:cytochrome C oxidoreductase [Deltaproteobacteria bacterium]
MGGAERKTVQDKVELGEAGRRLYMSAGGAGVLALAGAFGIGLSMGDGLKQFLHSYLVAFCFFLSLSLGALFFVAVMRVTRGGWGVVVRRIGEIVASATPVFALLALVLVIPMFQGNHALYPWIDHDHMAHNPLLAKKLPYLNATFLAVRWVVYFAAWIFMARFLLKRSVEQDASGDPKLTTRAEAFSAPAILVYAITVTFFSFDALMSLAPEWYSTIFGVYFFSGCM